MNYVYIVPSLSLKYLTLNIVMNIQAHIIVFQVVRGKKKGGGGAGIKNWKFASQKKKMNKLSR